MRLISSAEIDLYPGSQQERLPGFSPQFPHICSRMFCKYSEGVVCRQERKQR